MNSGVVLAAGDQRINAVETLSRFYEVRGYQPAWPLGNRPRAAAQQLVTAIEASAADGFRPADYHLEQMKALLSRHGTAGLSAAEQARFDVLLSDAYLLLAAHNLAGRLNPESIHAEWFANRRSMDLAAYLGRALDEKSVAKSLQALLPPQKGYWKLRETLAAYRKIDAKGGWTTVPVGAALKPGNDNPRIAALRRRLAEWRGLFEQNDGGRRFDESLTEEVKAFQRQHGLEADGVVGKETLAALNVTTKERIEQLIVNLERWRWLPQELGKRYVLVNIAGFYLEAVEDGETRQQHQVIVGRGYRQTPVFSDTISYLVFNPSWSVPRSLAVQDKLPVIRENPDYLRQQNFAIYQGGADGPPVDPTTIDWSRLSNNYFPYRLVQAAGPNNALGQVKFMFPNKFNVYLHDTPTRDLFAKAKRSFSSGCIRVEDPMRLAEFILGTDTGWSRPRIDETVAARVEKTVSLPTKIPVHLLYWTVWVDQNGAVQFRDDIYGRDGQVMAALAAPPPSIATDQTP